MNNKFSKFIKKFLAERSSSQVMVFTCVSVVIVMSAWGIISHSIDHSGEKSIFYFLIGFPVPFLEFMLYLYPVGFIINSYMAACQISIKKEISRRTEDQDVKYKMFSTLAWLPYVNVVMWIPFSIYIISVYPIFKSVVFSLNFLLNIIVYIGTKYQNALERMVSE